MSNPLESSSGRHKAVPEDLSLGEDPPPSDILAGPLNRPLLRLALPMLGGFLFQIGFNYVDTYFVGHLGADALAAVGSTMFVVWALFALAEAVTVGVMALVARAVGARDGAEAGAVVLAGVVLCVALGLVGACGGQSLIPSLVASMNLKPVPSQLGIEYLRVLFYGYPTLIGFLLLESSFRGAGDTRTPMTVLAGIFLLNMVLDRILIFGLGPLPAFGVAGAAAASVTSRGIGCLILLPLLWRRRRRLGFGQPGPGWLTRGRCLRIVRIGAPASAAGLSFCLIYLALVRITSEFGTAAVAALGLGLRMEGLSFFVILSLGRAAATIAGQNMGAGQPERARDVARRAELFGVVAMVPLTIAMLVLPELVIELFIDDPRVIEAAALYLRVVSWALIPFVGEVVLDNVASGVGDTFPAMVIEIVGTGLRIPLALGLAALGAGYVAVWWSVALTMLIKAVAFEVWFRRGRWRRTGVGP